VSKSTVFSQHDRLLATMYDSSNAVDPSLHALFPLDGSATVIGRVRVETGGRQAVRTALLSRYRSCAAFAGTGDSAPVPPAGAGVAQQAQSPRATRPRICSGGDATAGRRASRRSPGPRERGARRPPARRPRPGGTHATRRPTEATVARKSRRTVVERPSRPQDRKRLPYAREA